MKRTRLERIRLGIMFASILAVFALVAARLVHLQIILAPTYERIVVRQSTGQVEIPAERGIVYDRYGRQVVKNVVRYALYAYPESEKELREASRYLDRFYDYTSGTALKKFKLQVGKFRYVERGLPDASAHRIEREAPPGLHLREETRREYPFGNVGKQILGFTSVDGKGLAGFEYSHDSLLSGIPGIADYRRDGLQRTYRVHEQALVRPQPGKSVVLTIDWRLQEIVEQELENAVAKHNAKLGRAVFLDCNSGDILAIAHFDPEEEYRGRPDKLRAITDQFEPGSVMKPFGGAAMIDAGLVKYSDTIYCEEGKWKMGRRTLHDDKELGWLTFREIIELSSNIGIGKYACELGGEELAKAYERFGYGTRTGCGLPGEVSGSVVRSSVWSDYNISALAMGHSIAANALQIANGFAAIANGGELLQPHVLLGEVAADGSVINERSRTVIKRATEKSSVDSLRAILRGVVDVGTATPAYSEIVSIAGKTGTAEVTRPDGRGYIKNRFIASFAGFFPSDKPVIAGIVVLDQPHPIHYGGYTSGPAFRAVAERYVVANPDLFFDPHRALVARQGNLDGALETPSFVGHEMTDAVRRANKAGLQVRSNGENGNVIWQFPPPDRVMFENEEVVLAVARAEEVPTMTDVTGLPLRKAVALLSQTGVECTVRGSGRVVQQSIRPGTPLKENSVCNLVCKPGQGI